MRWRTSKASLAHYTDPVSPDFLPYFRGGFERTYPPFSRWGGVTQAPLATLFTMQLNRGTGRSVLLSIGFVDDVLSVRFG